jgi:hypothetical protein
LCHIVTCRGYLVAIMVRICVCRPRPHSRSARVHRNSFLAVPAAAWKAEMAVMKMKGVKCDMEALHAEGDLRSFTTYVVHMLSHKLWI